MADPLEIVLKIVNERGAVTGIKNAAKATDDLGKAEQRTQRIVQYATGPYGRLAKLQSQLGQARASRNVTAQMDLEHLIKRQQGVIGRINSPRQSTPKWIQALTTSRFAVGQGGFSLHPLIGRVLAAAGPSAPILAMGTAAAVAATGLYQLASSTAAAGGFFTRLQNQLGSSGRTTSVLSAVGGAIGLGPNEIGGLSQSIQQRITSDGFARAAAAGMGIQQMARPLGSVDEGGNVLRIAQGLRKIKDDEEALRQARILGAEALLPLRLLEQSTFDSLVKDAELRAKLYGPDFRRKSAEFDASVSRFEAALDRLKVSVGSHLLGPITSGLNSLGEIGGDKLGKATTKDWALGIYDAARDFFFHAGSLGATDPNQIIQPGAKHPLEGALDGHKHALEANTEALNKTILSFEGMRNMYARGERTDAAIPKGMTFEWLRQMLAQGGSLPLSQF